MSIDLEIYRRLRTTGISPEAACVAARQHGLSAGEQVAMLQAVYELSLVDARLATIRAAGLAESGDPWAPRRARRRSGQFSLAQLLWATAAVAVFMAATRYADWHAPVAVVLLAGGWWLARWACNQTPRSRRQRAVIVGASFAAHAAILYAPYAVLIVADAESRAVVLYPPWSVLFGPPDTFFAHLEGAAFVTGGLAIATAWSLWFDSRLPATLLIVVIVMPVLYAMLWWIALRGA